MLPAPYHGGFERRCYGLAAWLPFEIESKGLQLRVSAGLRPASHLLPGLHTGTPIALFSYARILALTAAWDNVKKKWPEQLQHARRWRFVLDYPHESATRKHGDTQPFRDVIQAS